MTQPLVDVVVLSVRESLNTTQKQNYLDWFAESIKDTSLEPCKVILLDNGATVQVFRGPMDT